MAHRKIVIIEDCEDPKHWTALNGDSLGPYASGNRVYGEFAVEWWKDDTATDSTRGGVYTDLTTPINLLEFCDNGVPVNVGWHVFIPSLTDVAYAGLQLGSSSANYREWHYPDTALVAGYWNLCECDLGHYDLNVGTGWSPSTPIEYVGVLVGFDLESDTLEGMVADRVFMKRTTYHG